MAQVIRCDGCGELPADVLVSNVHNGEVLAFDLKCSGLWAEGHAAAMKGLFEAQAPDPVGQAGSGELGAGNDDPRHPLPPREEDPVAQRPGIVDTPSATPPGPDNVETATLPAAGEPDSEAAAGGGNDGSIRRDDRGLDAGDRSAADQLGSGDTGGDRRGGRSGTRTGGRNVGRQRTDTGSEELNTST